MAFEPHPQPPSGLSSSEPFFSAHGRSLVVVGLFVAYIVTTLASVGLTLTRLAVPDVVLANDAEAQLTLMELLEFVVAIPVVLVNLALIVAFLVWLHRVSKNIPALGNPKSRVEYTPGWAVGSFFIPIASLYMPYRGLKEVWVKSDPGVRAEGDFMSSPLSSGTPLLVGWWAAWITHNILTNLYLRLQWRAGAGDGAPFLIALDVISDVAGIVAAALAILVVRGIDRRQVERSRHVTYVSRTPPPPPLFTPQPPPVPPQRQQF